MHTSVPQKKKRIESIDVFRALIVLLMIFVNDLWSISEVPHWMGHADFDEDFLGLSDIVFPAFLFILGMSIPLAIGGRIRKGQSRFQLVRHIVSRSLALLVMGVFSVNSGRSLSREVGISGPVYSLLMLLGFFLIWNSYPHDITSSLKQKIYSLFQVLGCILLVYLGFIYRDLSGATLKPKWWGILGLIGWTYLVCALLYLFLHKKHRYLIISALCFTLLCVLGTAGYLGSLNNVVLSNGCFYAFTMFGLLLTLLLNDKTYAYIALANKLKVICCIGVVFILLGWLFNRWWIISKLQETSPWLFYSTGITILVYVFIYWLVDIQDKGIYFKLIKPAGTATLTCYLVPSLYYAISQIINFRIIGAFAKAPLGLLKCLCFSLLCILTTNILGKMSIKLKI